MTRRMVIAVLALSFAALWGATAYSADIKTYRIVNRTGVAAADLHLDFSGTAGVCTTVVLGQPGGCPVAVIGFTNPVVIDWNNACVPNGTNVDIRVRTPNGPLAFNSGFWTDTSGTSVGAIGAGDITLIEKKVPSLTAYGLIILALLLAGTAVWMFQRRRVGVAA